MIKKIAMVGILGLALVLATAALYTQSAFAAIGVAIGSNGVNPSSGGSGSGQNSQGQYREKAK